MPELRVEIETIAANVEAVAALLRSHGLDLVGVTKGCLGEPRVAAAMLAGGAVALADSRDANLSRLRRALPEAELHRIYLPSLAGPFESGDITYVSTREGAEAVAALRPTRARRVMLQVETGDRREGALPEEVTVLAREIARDTRLEMAGLSTNYACFQGASEGLAASVDMVARTAASLRSDGLAVNRVSGGNSSVLRLLLQGSKLPSEVTEIRCGEALLLGHDALLYEPIPGCRGDACVLRAEVLEGYTKPARGKGARRLVLGIGWQDLGGGAVKFLDRDLREVGRSADYLVVEAINDSPRASAGVMVDMIPAYESLVAAWTSPYVELKLI
jgi:ornithine racemase